jgi:hypothetical protein
VVQQNENPYNLFSDKVSVIVGEDVVEQVSLTSLVLLSINNSFWPVKESKAL